MAMTGLGRWQEKAILSPSNTGHRVISGSKWEACGGEIITQDFGMDDKGPQVVFYECGVQGGGHMLEKCLEAGLPVGHPREDILGETWQLGRVSSWETDMRP